MDKDSFGGVSKENGTHAPGNYGSTYGGSMVHGKEAQHRVHISPPEI